MQIAFYKDTHAGIPGIYNRLVRWWTRGPYSHCELIFSNGLSASSSFMDGGVRFKQITFDADKWDIINIPTWLEPEALRWFTAHDKQAYDLLGNLHFIVGAVGDDKRKWFCSEAIAAALGIRDPWRFDPNALAAILFSNQA